jgi:hypothetical protein
MQQLLVYSKSPRECAVEHPAAALAASGWDGIGVAVLCRPRKRNLEEPAYDRVTLALGYRRDPMDDLGAKGD